ncbi:unnamed protein product [Brachionus calyciflorus]|uniref:G patch domain-containing protein 4 n=1 Tax=Brachionus calyciflorus TaxID=104777 RepID=A0A813MI03_9BILA|nr:unnamed protein product [Brachionus calyciflorus]
MGLSSKFAENQLKKFGWKEGDGIGKNNQGMSAPIKVSLKFNTTGVGFNLAEQFTNNWWENLYNTTAKGIEGAEQRIGQKTETKPNNALNRKSFFYSRFQKESTLVDGQEIKQEKKETDEEREAKEKKEREEKELKVKKVSDEDLFKLCEGRTAHKGARHGIKMNGKLARLEEQERILADKLLNKLNSEEKKDKKRKKEEIIEQTETSLEVIEPIEDTSSVKKKKKKSKKSHHDE